MGCYADRRQAGRVLASALSEYASKQNIVVLALPRGGVPVAHEVAQRLGAPLDVLVVRKLGIPGYEELAMGALASGGVLVLNEETIEYLGIPESLVDAAVEREGEEVARRERAYRGDRPPLDVTGKTVILVDDGLATGASMRAAIAAVRLRGPARVVVAVPIAAPTTWEVLRSEVDDVVCAATPEHFHSVGQWYVDFSQTTDEEIREILDGAAQARAA